MNRGKKGKASRREKSVRTSHLDDPFAVTTSGTVLLNMQNFDEVGTAENALRRALQERTRIFIGVAMSAREASFALGHMGDVWQDPAGFIIGARQRRVRSRRS